MTGGVASDWRHTRATLLQQHTSSCQWPVLGPMHSPLLQYRVDLLAEVELAVDVAHPVRQLQRTQQDPLSQGEGEPQHVVGV